MDIMQIEKFENIKGDSGEVERSLIIGKDKNGESKEFEVFLAFIDNQTRKR